MALQCPFKGEEVLRSVASTRRTQIDRWMQAGLNKQIDLTTQTGSASFEKFQRRRPIVFDTFQEDHTRRHTGTVCA